MANFHEAFIGAMLEHLFGRPDAVRDYAFVMKRPKDPGDYSFPLDMRAWTKALLTPPTNVADGATVFELHEPSDDDSLDSLLDSHLAALKENLNGVIAHSSVYQRRVIVHLNRPLTFGCLTEILHAGAAYGRNTLGGRNVFVRHLAIERADEDGECSDEAVEVDVESESESEMNEEGNITDYRCTLVRRVLGNLIAYSAFRLVDNVAEADCCLAVTHKSTETGAATVPETRLILCGVVKAASSGDKGSKMSGMLAAEYVRTRQTHMERIRQQKSGVELPGDAASTITNALSCRLGRAAVTFDLLEVRHSSPVALALEQHSGGASRGAAFVLYNSARIEKLLAAYAQQISDGHYGPPGEVEQTDWSLLKEEEEWQLMFDYVLAFPDVVRRSLGDLEAGQIAPHLICAFLSGLARCFSVYYRRVRILDYNRKHLMETLHSRMRLVLALRNVLNQALALLDMQPLQNM